MCVCGGGDVTASLTQLGEGTDGFWTYQENVIRNLSVWGPLMAGCCKALTRSGYSCLPPTDQGMLPEQTWTQPLRVYSEPPAFMSVKPLRQIPIAGKQQERKTCTIITGFFVWINCFRGPHPACRPSF